MKIGKLLLWILIWQIPLWIGARIVQQNMDWYHSLAHPFFSPPDWLFGFVWAVLYILLALAAFYITKAPSHAHARKALWLMLLQLALNTAWTPLFFGMHQIQGAMILLLMMLAATIWLMLITKRFSKPAVWLLIPYLAWLCFAGILNTAIGLMN